MRFAEKSQLYIVDRHQDKNDLWYVKAEYNSMKRNLKRDVLQARARDYSASKEEDGGFWIGISHLLTPACAFEVQSCRRRCVHAVLAEQAIQGPSASLRCEDIAFASSAQTRRAVFRARKLGKLHQDSIKEYCSSLGSCELLS